MKIYMNVVICKEFLAQVFILFTITCIYFVFLNVFKVL